MTRDALARRNVHIQSMSCPMCGDTEESVDHLFTGCMVATILWQHVANWGNIQSIFVFSVDNLVRLHLSVEGGSEKRQWIHALVYSAVSCLWNERNAVVLKNKPVYVESILSNTTSYCRFWVKHRGGVVM
ncbi:hypothetical protein SSX86_019012 [Deinandra increscens subsp. villosa]|uniref:Reverse transcriptase zinc-binding domain-containing protein n=1 Tax=Deinandra increscens subsp. villosa TaxID=3103831 RepID=A0AAP0GV95_9ASTR